MKEKLHCEFEIEKDRLTSNEEKVLDKLIEASKLIVPLYEEQVNEELPGSNFYPADATREEVKQAAEEDPEILSHYTVVERDDAGNLVAVPYHEKYAEEMGQIADLLDEAAEISEDDKFAEFLAARAQAFRDDSWSESEDLWLDLGDNKIDILIGPIEPYLDELFSVKYAFQSNVRVASDDRRFNPKDYIRVIRNLHASSPMQPSKQQEVKIRVDDVVCLSGRHAVLPPRGTNLPNDPEKVKEKGTKIIIYTTDIKLRDQDLILPIFRKIFPSDFVDSYTDEEFLAAAVQLAMLHEITEAVVKYPDSVERLGDMYLPVKELHASVVGLKSCTFHVLKGILDQKEYKAVLAVLLARTFSDWLIKDKSGRNLMHYLRGYVVTFNFFCEHGGVTIENSHISLNFERLFVGTEGLASVLSHLMASGSREEAKQFFDCYGCFDLFEKFTAPLETIEVHL